MSKIAIVQEPPVFLNKIETLKAMVQQIDRAASKGAELIVFSEAHISGYPAWVWRLKPGGDWGLYEDIHARMVENAIDLSTDDLKPVYDAAARHHVTVVCGINDRDSEGSRSTLYNSVVIIGPDGALLNRHRKLMPTNPERMVWGFGDASGLKVVDTPAGRVGSLICWENFMPLARYALYAQGIDVYIAPTYDTGDNWIGTLQHIAREACCWVIGSGTVLRGKDIPADFPDKSRLYPDENEWINVGGSIVIAPGGEIMAGPMKEETGILYADIDLKRVTAARRSLDIVGHYSRPDLFTLQVDAKEQTSIEIKD